MNSLQPGWLLIRIEGDTVRFLNRCAAESVSIGRFSSTGSIAFGYLPGREWSRAKLLAEQSGVRLTALERDGVSYALWRYRRRLGLAVGPVLMTGLLLFSQCFLWAIDINGCENLSQELILQTAAGAGLYKGRFLPACDMDAVADTILEEIPGVSFCAVNKIGSRVEIEINEVTDTPIVLPSDPCSIFAAETGQIVYMEVYNGQETVKVGEAVGKGQLLVNGITESADGKTRYVHASASIIADAKFSHTFTLDLTQIEKSYTGRTENRYSLELFGGQLPLYLPDGAKKALEAAGTGWERLKGFLFDGPETDPQPEETQQLLWDSQLSRAPLTLLGIRLPIGLVTERRDLYTEETRTFTEEEAASLLQEAAAAWEQENLTGGQILERSEQMEIKGGTAVLQVDYLCRMDIASTRKIEAELETP